MKKRFRIVLAMALASVMVLSACGSSTGTDVWGIMKEFGSYQAESFSAPRQASLADFDWHYKPSKDRQVEYKDATYSPEGIWELVIERKKNKNSGYQKELYWIQIRVLPPQMKLTDVPGSLDVYTYTAFMNSEEAKNAGIEKDTATRLVEMLNEGNGSVKAYATVIPVGVEDSSGNYTADSKQTPFTLEGVYFPEKTYLQFRDKKGNFYTFKDFATSNGTEQCVGTYATSNQDMSLNGLALITK